MRQKFKSTLKSNDDIEKVLKECFLLVSFLFRPFFISVKEVVRHEDFTNDYSF